MVERDFGRSEGAKPIRFSGGQFGFVVETFYDARRDLLLGTEPVEQERAVSAQHARHLLHGLDPGSHRLRTPGIQELPRPMRRRIVPEELEALFEEETSNGFQVVSEQIH